MPQMMPLNWMFMYFISLLIIIIFISMIYHLIINNFKFKTNNIYCKKNWYWMW